MEPIDPKFVPKLARKVAKWQREHGAVSWSTTAVSGTTFIAPPSVPSLVHKASGVQFNRSTREGVRLPSEEMLASYQPLARYYAETLERAKCFHLSERISNLALRTVMPKYKLTLDALRIGKDGGFVPWGFIVWSLPISKAENTGLVSQLLDFRTGQTTYPEMAKFSPYDDADLPVVAASWRYEPDAHLVWVAFYTQNTDQTRILQQLGKLTTPEEVEQFQRLREPLTLEREQALPLDVSRNWCDADPADGPRLDLTAGADPDSYDRPHLREEAIRNNDAARVLVSDMVRTLIASWMILKWKVTHREEIPPPQDVIRKVAKETGHSKKTIAKEHGTTVVRLGGPIRKRSAKSDGKEYTWSVRALVGPVVRERQYIPAWGTYDEEPRFIEPYWAGPPDAPISNIDRVFTLAEEQT